jgi:hypothetical protein
MKELWRRLQWFARRDRFESELDEEMRHHLALKRSKAALVLRTMSANKLFSGMAVVSLIGCQYGYLQFHGCDHDPGAAGEASRTTADCELASEGCRRSGAILSLAAEPTWKLWA